MIRFSSLLLWVAMLLVARNAHADGHLEGAALVDQHCEGHCTIHLGPFDCKEALERFEFSGNCCSLHEDPTSGHCQLWITNGFCDYADKGYEKCMDDLEDSGEALDEIHEAVCGTIRMYSASTNDECPASSFDIPDPFLDNNSNNESNNNLNDKTVIEIVSELVFQFDNGKGRPPSGKEMVDFLQATKSFFTEYLSQQKEVETIAGYITSFELEDVREKYNDEQEQATITFDLVFHMADEHAKEDVPATKELLEEIIGQADLQGHIEHHISQRIAHLDSEAASNVATVW